MPTPPRRWFGWVRWFGWSVMALLALAMALLAGRYLSFDPDVYFPQQRAVYLANTAALALHVAGGMLAVLLGPLQFLPAVRNRWLRGHRWTGRVYLVGIAVGGLAGLWLARLAYGGWPARLGFAALALAWLGTSAMAYLRIRTGQVHRHREWMIRSYALTFAAVTLRFEQGLLAVAGVPFLTAYIAVAWLSWVPNLVVAEWIVRRSRRRARPATADAPV